jgi:hypothetical protein
MINGLGESCLMDTIGLGRASRQFGFSGWQDEIKMFSKYVVASRVH